MGSATRPLVQNSPRKARELEPRSTRPCWHRIVVQGWLQKLDSGEEGFELNYAQPLGRHSYMRLLGTRYLVW